MCFPQNSGFGLDLGAFYKLNEKWDISASVIDLGFIKWSTERVDYVSNGEFEFEGIDADLSNDKPVEDGAFDAVLDSIGEALEFEEVEGGPSYTKALPSRIFLGANYKLNEKHAFGGVYHMKLWNGKAYHDFSVNYQSRLSRGFQYTVSYSVINGTYNNVGLGMQFKAGPMQLYLISDNVLDIIWYENLQSSNMRAGLNITLFDKKDKRHKKVNEERIENEDVPLPDGNL